MGYWPGSDPEPMPSYFARAFTTAFSYLSPQRSWIYHAISHNSFSGLLHLNLHSGRVRTMIHSKALVFLFFLVMVVFLIFEQETKVLNSYTTSKFSRPLVLESFLRQSRNHERALWSGSSRKRRSTKSIGLFLWFRWNV